MKAQDLKNSILQLAVQGKLVEQDPNDEPASVLLERIREERAQLIKEKKIKKPKGGESVIYRGSDGSRYEKRVDAKGRESEPVCIDEEIPFEIPEGWEWARVGELGDWKAGATPAKTKSEYHTNGTVPWLLTGDLNDSVITNIPNRITQLAVEECSVRLNPVGSILVAMYGATIGKTGVLGIPATTNQACCACILFDRAVQDWLLIWLKYYKPFFIRLGEGGAQPNISREKIVSRLIPVPPLAEQRRIAGRVSELMPLVEEYGELEDAREALDAALPDRLRKSVLQLAAQGKLVEQDPNDEPASVLLERIREERAQLIKEKKIKKPKGGESVIYRKGGSWYERRGKSEPACIDDEIPFDIPESWEWCRFESLLVNRDVERIPVSVSDREKLEKIYDYYGASGVIDKVDKYLFSKPLLLIGEDGANLINRSTPIAFIARGKYWVNNHAHVIDGHCEQLLVYVATYINSISLIPYITGTAQPKMNQQRMGSILVPVPPLAEQQRIVEKVDQIMKLIGA